MPRTTIKIHLPAYRRRALELQTDAREAADAYDVNIGRYIEYLKVAAAAAGLEVTTDTHDDGPTYAIEEEDHARKKAAHDWLETIPDIWNWIP